MRPRNELKIESANELRQDEESKYSLNSKNDKRLTPLGGDKPKKIVRIESPVSHGRGSNTSLISRSNISMSSKKPIINIKRVDPLDIQKVLLDNQSLVDQFNHGREEQDEEALDSDPNADHPKIRKSMTVAPRTAANKIVDIVHAKTVAGDINFAVNGASKANEDLEFLKKKCLIDIEGKFKIYWDLFMSGLIVSHLH